MARRVTLHYALVGEGELKLGSGEILPLPTNSLAVIPPTWSMLCSAVPCSTKPVAKVRVLRMRPSASWLPERWIG